MLPALQPAEGRRDVQHVQRAVCRRASIWRSGRAPGHGSAHTAIARCSAIAARPPPDDFPEQLAESRSAISDARCRGSHPFRRLSRPASAYPTCPIRGCSDRRRRAASGPRNSDCRTPLPISSAQADSEIAARYRRGFTPSMWRGRPEVIARCLGVVRRQRSTKRVGSRGQLAS